MRRLGISLVTALLLVLLVEGALSLLRGATIRSLFQERTYLDRVMDTAPAPEIDRFAAAAGEPGAYRVHHDPRINYVLKSETVVEVAGAEVETDAFGMRVRPGPPVAEDATRIVVLGDSVAFGQGIEDAEDVLAARLESVLAEARGPEAPRVACFTVAVPGWNYRNAIQYLRNYWRVLEPDVVLYLHVRNDLNDGYGVYETGHRRKLTDASSPDPLLHYDESAPYFRRGAVRLREAGITPDASRIGPAILDGGLTRASAGRLEDMAAHVADLYEWLESMDVRFALVPYVQHTLHRQMRARLIRRGAAVPVIPLFEELTREDTLGDDPHPSAATVSVMATWVAESLLELGWIEPGAGGSPPPVGREYADRRATELADDEVLSWSADYEAGLRDALEPTLQHETLRGMRQVHGGVHLDGAMGPELLAVLPPGERLSVTLAPVPGRPEQLPVRVRVDVDDETIGTVTLSDAEAPPTTAVFPLPEDARTSPFEVRLVADRWFVRENPADSTLLSARFLELASL